MSNNGSIIELVAKGKLDEDIVELKNTKSFFDYKIAKTNKYTKGDTIFYPEGKAAWGNTFRVKIQKQGDLLYGLYLIVRLPKLSIANLNTPQKQDENDTTSKYRIKYSNFIGNVLVDKVSLYMNGALIDEQYGDYMQYYTDLYFSDSNRKSMIGLDDVCNKPNLKIDSETIYIPLKFWFCNQTCKPLPLIAMQYTDIYVDIKFRNFNECITVLEYNNSNNLFLSNYTHPEVPIINVCLQANFYYLDLTERTEMATKEYEILITQAQLKSANFKMNASLLLDFNHVVKDMIFLIQSNTNVKYGDYFNVSAKTEYPVPSLSTISDNGYKLWSLEPKRHLLDRARLLFNGSTRIDWRDAKYFYNMQNHENYRNTLHSYVYMYSFNIDPTKYSNNSGCNFSRIENPYLQIDVTPDNFYLDPNVNNPSSDGYTIKCFATNFNILIIKNGLVGLKYNN
jgi:hypothetical protein